MALMIVEGVVEEVGAATPLVSETGPTGTSWAFVRFSRARKTPTTLDRVVADTQLGARIMPKQAGRFAFYGHGGELVLCGYAGPGGIELTSAASDPATLAAEAIRLPAKRKIFWGILLIPTIIGLFFAPQMIKAGRVTLHENPAPRRPSPGNLTRALKGQLYWPFS